MKTLIIMGLLLSTTYAFGKTLILNRDVFKTVPFSSQYSEDGALIKNVHFPSVNALIPQLNALYGINLEDRGEAHITVITPPEDQTALSKVFKTDEILSRYKSSIQSIPFEIICVGSRKSSDGKKLVFYLVVKAPELFDLRKDLAQEAKVSAFKPEEFWPHITIGYVNGDVFEFTKGPESCLPGVELVIQ